MGFALSTSYFSQPFIFSSAPGYIFSREPGSRVGVSLIPGETWTREWQGRAYVIENVLLYIPFGMLGMGVCYYVNRRGIYVVLASFLLFMSTENSVNRSLKTRSL